MEAVDLWHRRLGHLNVNDLKRLAEMSQGVKLTIQPKVDKVCGGYEIGKSKRQISRTIQREVQEKLELVDTNLGGPFPHRTLLYKILYIMITDRKTSNLQGYIMKYKHKVFPTFLGWKTIVETQSGQKIRRVHLNNRKEYLNKKFKKLFKEYGILWECSILYYPEQNRLSEVQNRIVIGKVRCILFDIRLGKYLQGELFHTGIILKNRSPTHRLKGKTPFEVQNRYQPDLSNFRIIGYITWVYILKEKRKKLDKRSKKYYLVKYKGINQYRLQDPSSRKVIRVRDVVFDETNLMLTTIKNDSDWPEYPVGRVTTIGDEGGETLGSHHQEQYPAIAPDFNDFDNSLESTPENPETPKENGNPEEEELLDGL